MIVLDVDMGNSCCKWRLRSGADVLRSGAVVNRDVASDASGYEAIFSDFVYVPDEVWVSSVVGRQLLFDECCVRLWGVTPYYAVVTREAAGVTNGYKCVEQMGVDRWLAVLAAYYEVRGPCLVVDMGTAPTVDFVLPCGLQRGGYITPGMQLMGDALCRNTNGVKLTPTAYPANLLPGESTMAAVAAGFAAMQVGLVMMSLDECASLGMASPTMLLTGGGSLELARLVRDKVASDVSLKVRPDLVLDGLSLAVKYKYYPWCI